MAKAEDLSHLGSHPEMAQLHCKILVLLKDDPELPADHTPDLSLFSQSGSFRQYLLYNSKTINCIVAFKLFRYKAGSFPDSVL